MRLFRSKVCVCSNFGINRIESLIVWSTKIHPTSDGHIVNPHIVAQLHFIAVRFMHIEHFTVLISIAMQLFNRIICYLSRIYNLK